MKDYKTGLFFNNFTMNLSDRIERGEEIQFIKASVESLR
ncbi:hypothetical protein FFONT_0018 [Fervidicoccus fontis Kam940]|uniref:Uncharacterized protein n=1 Tax=Fervidicoccus fontis (strain DSM 19380 / JCM 18336 / VKM B-2539 / Kam940) TaxID=1163730 RepID=H9ZZ57_FERFK|nr:hypothetical protein FFONT_0018 [Fervidicoccus fontis Kam940]